MHVMTLSTGRFTYKQDAANAHVAEFKSKMRHPTLEIHFTDELFYINCAVFAPAIAELAHGPATWSPAFDFAWGWHLNRKRPMRLGSKATLLLGTGFNFGLFAVRTFPPQYAINTTPVYIGPTLSANLQIRRRLNIQNTIRINYSTERRTQHTSGNGSSLTSLVSYKVGNKIGVSAAVNLVGYTYEKMKETAATKDMKYRYSTRSLQLGVCFLLD